jgi:ABC-type branched-subunit amino acid transport system substrate-binding protein
MRSPRVLALTGALCVLGVVPAVAPFACSSGGGGGGGTGALSPAGTPLVIGVPNELTGSLEGTARAFNGAVQTAQQEINAAGGILGRQVTFAVKDDTSEPAEALSVAKGFVSGGAIGLIGPGGSSMVQSVEPFAAMSKVVEISASATAVSLTASQSNQTGFFFRTVPNDSLQGQAVALFALSGPGDAGASACQTMVVVHNNDTYGIPLAQTLESVFTSKGGTVLADISIPENALASYNTSAPNNQVAQVLAAAPQCLVLAVYAPAGDAFMQNLSDALPGGMNPMAPADWSKSFFVIATDGCYDPSFISGGNPGSMDASANSWVNGTYPGSPPLYGTVASTNDHDRQYYNQLEALYVADVGFAPGQTDMDPYTSTEYDAAVLIALAIQAAGSATDGAAIQKAMFAVSHGTTSNPTPFGPAQLPDAIATLRSGGDINYQGASGDVDFNAQGDVVSGYLVWRIQGNAFVSFTTIGESLLSATPVDAGP